jgi:hypothetical protein
LQYEEVSTACGGGRVRGGGPTVREGVCDAAWPEGERIGQILLPETVSNIRFGGPKRNRLFITAGQSLYAGVRRNPGRAYRLNGQGSGVRSRNRDKSLTPDFKLLTPD